MTAPPQGHARVRIWDAPTRIFHWAIALLIPFLWWTAEEERLDLHIPAGLTMFGLILFRLLWGLVGSSTARFVSFVKGPWTVARYLAGRASPVIGHSPLGAFSVVAMLSALAAQVGLGLFASDEDGLFSGPLAHLVSYETSETLTDWHDRLFDLLLILIGLHLAAVLFYLIVRRRNLVLPMVTGAGEGEDAAMPMRPAPAWRFWIAATIAAGAALWIGGAFA
ncbi:cytochrome b/b6 domain-containing protein [Sphingosinicella sp. LHD-64]|uniref:cytochrome b/b6 domain-containing protein n=1 Tax=Sphingosinicella sp. LHD-64 TaxID=3072139 RepID=UPI00280F65EC|nr:cytochrome b/b6 domain-containing protein [Sphingosinicella sp. LHD-64]MDQ8754725.1 cytochrome b/b6 domain-containing protein [Sphingosinicella sp. LHD-64]